MTMDPNPPAAPVEPVALAPRARSRSLLDLLLVGAAILAVGGVAFAIGRSTAPAGAFPGVGGLGGGPIVRFEGSFDPDAGGPGGVALGGGLAIDGSVTAIDADSVTITLDDGQEMTFALDAETTYREATDATPADVAVGDDVSVKVAGAGQIRNGNGGDGGAAPPELTAGEVTVSR